MTKHMNTLYMTHFISMENLRTLMKDKDKKIFYERKRLDEMMSMKRCEKTK